MLYDIISYILYFTVSPELQFSGAKFSDTHLRGPWNPRDWLLFHWSILLKTKDIKWVHPEMPLNMWSRILCTNTNDQNKDQFQSWPWLIHRHSLITGLLIAMLCFDVYHVYLFRKIPKIQRQQSTEFRQKTLAEVCKVYVQMGPSWDQRPGLQPTSLSESLIEGILVAKARSSATQIWPGTWWDHWNSAKLRHVAHPAVLKEQCP
jgi:hypothetical protein